jgi:hypothetical protein
VIVVESSCMCKTVLSPHLFPQQASEKNSQPRGTTEANTYDNSMSMVAAAVKA